METGEGTPKLRTVTVEAPPIIDNNRNFLDQEPFSRVIDMTSQRTAIPVSELRVRIIGSTQAAKQIEAGEDKYQYVTRHAYLDAKQFTDEQISEIAKRTAVLNTAYSTNMAKFERKEIAHIVEAMLKVLNKYPYWMAYVDSQMQGVFYHRSGDPRKKQVLKSTADTPVPSYGAWAQERIMRERSVFSAGIEEIFPQDINNELPELGQGKKRESKRWILLGAADRIDKKP